MSNRFFLGIGVLVLAASTLTGTNAALAQAHKAHVHGSGKLFLAIEGQNVEMELESPADDIVGFEHPPATDADRKAIATAREKLMAGESLFVFPADATCRLHEAAVKSSLLAPPAEAGHHDHDHGNKHDHAEKHDHDKKSATEDVHSEFHAQYHFICNNIRAVTRIDTRYFELFPRAVELDVQTATDRGQGKYELTRNRNRISF